MKIAAWMLALLGVLAGMSRTSEAAAAARYSGAVVSIDVAAGKLVVAEVGPWLVKDGRTVTTTRRIQLTPATVYERVARSDTAPSGFAGDFVESPIKGSGVAVGDQVTVVGELRGPQMVAEKIIVIELDR